MSDKKNIERLFQEKFKDFEAKPSDKVWSQIAENLEEKKSKKRVIPFWIKAGGIAASLLFGNFTYDNYSESNGNFNNNDNGNKSIVNVGDETFMSINRHTRE
jgi:hypothetical protein